MISELALTHRFNLQYRAQFFKPFQNFPGLVETFETI